MDYSKFLCIEGGESESFADSDGEKEALEDANQFITDNVDDADEGEEVVVLVYKLVKVVKGVKKVNKTVTAVK